MNLKRDGGSLCGNLCTKQVERTGCGVGEAHEQLANRPQGTSTDCFHIEACWPCGYLYLRKVLLTPFTRVKTRNWAHNPIEGIQSRTHKCLVLVVWALSVQDTQAPLDGIHSWISFNNLLVVFTLFHVVVVGMHCSQRDKSPHPDLPTEQSQLTNAHSHWSIGFALAANPDVGFCPSGCTASLRPLPRRRAVGQRHIIAERNQMHQPLPRFRGK